MTAMFGGMAIYPQANWPKVERGTRTVRFRAHPLILWLARWLRLPARTTYQEAAFPNMVDADAVVDQVHGRLFCSLAQADYLRRHIRASMPAAARP